MTAKKIVVFGTEGILAHKPSMPGQRPVYDGPSNMGTRIQVYSTGRLELALRRGHTPYLVTMMPAGLPWNAWLTQLLPPEQLLFTEDIFDADAATLFRRIMVPWQTLYEHLGYPWIDTKLKTPTAAKQHLIDQYGVIDGDTLDDFANN